MDKPEGNLPARRTIILNVLGLGLLISALLACIVAVRGFACEGVMPSGTVAASIRNDVLRYATACAAEPDKSHRLPQAVAKLKPLSLEVLPSGMLIVFRRSFVEDYGYFYCHGTLGVPEEIAGFCKEVSPGVYRYYNPG